MHVITRRVVLTLSAAAVACAAHQVLVPPRLDLHPYHRLAITTFTVENATGGLNQLATGQFVEAALQAQPGVEILELGPQDTLVRRVGETELGIAAAQEIGRQHDVGAVFAGHLKITNPQTTGGLGWLVSPHLEATIRADLTVRLVSTESGATLWRSSAWATRKVGQVRIVGGQLDFMARDPKQAYGPMVDRLVELVTEDFWSTWRKE
jgi:hypothetical protein